MNDTIAKKGSKNDISKIIKSSKKSSKKVSKRRKSSRKTSRKIVSKRRKSSRKTSRKVVSKRRKSSRKTSRKIVSKRRKSSRKTSRKVVSKRRKSPRKTSRKNLIFKNISEITRSKYNTLRYNIRHNTTYFKGSPNYNLLVMLYFKYKYKNECTVIPLNFEEIYSVFNKRGLRIRHEDVSIRYIEEKNKLSFPDEFWNYFLSCIDDPYIRYIIFPFGFTCKDSGHANYMVYDTKLKSLERFEPHGQTFGKCVSEPVDEMILEAFKENLGKDFVKTYYKPLDFCPPINLQTIQERQKEIGRNRKKIIRPNDPVGFCAAWAAFYADLRLLHPDIDRKELIRYAINEIHNQTNNFTTFIRNYSIFLNTIYDELFNSNIKNTKELENFFNLILLDLLIEKKH